MSLLPSAERKSKLNIRTSMQAEPCSLAQPWENPPTSGFLAGENHRGVCVFGDGQEVCPAILSHQHCLEKCKPLTTCCYLLSSEAGF